MKAPRKPKRITVKTYLTPDEHRFVQWAAEGLGLSVSAWLRTMAVQQMKRSEYTGLKSDLIPEKPPRAKKARRD